MIGEFDDTVSRTLAQKLAKKRLAQIQQNTVEQPALESEPVLPDINGAPEEPPVLPVVDKNSAPSGGDFVQLSETPVVQKKQPRWRDRQHIYSAPTDRLKKIALARRSIGI